MKQSTLLAILWSISFNSHMIASSSFDYKGLSYTVISEESKTVECIGKNYMLSDYASIIIPDEVKSTNSV